MAEPVDLRAVYDTVDSDEQWSLSYHGPKGTLTLTWTPVEPELPSVDPPLPSRPLMDKWKAEAGVE